MLAVPVQRDGSAHREEGAGSLVAELDPNLLIEESPPDHDRFAGELRVDLVGDAGDRHAAVQGDGSPLGLAGEGAEPSPGAHLAHALGGQVRQPVVHAAMRFGAMVAAVVGIDEARQPTIGLRLCVGLVEVVQGLVSVLHGAKGPLDLALGAGRGASAVRPDRHVRHHRDTQALHHAPEHRRLRDRPVVEVDGRGNALEGARFGIAVSGLARHGVEQEAERAFHVLAVDASVLLVGDTGAVVDHAEQHERGCARPVGVDPRRQLELLEVRGAHVELPERVSVLGLEADGGWLANHASVVVAQTSKVSVEG